MQLKMLHSIKNISVILWQQKLFFVLFVLNYTYKICYCEKCFDQEYSNTIVDLRTLQIIEKIAIISPLGAFYLQISGNFDKKLEEISNYVKKENGENLIVYSSISSTNLEWQTINVLTSVLRIVSVFDSDNISWQTVSPIVIVTVCPYKTRPIYLNAQSFTVDTYNSGLVSMYENELIINFRTFNNGIFFFSMADQGDLLVVQIKGGRIETFFDFGSLAKSTLFGGKALNDGEWHEIHWVHQFESVHLYIDKVLYNSTTPSGLYRKLDFNYQIEIGGRPEDQYSNEIETNFHGCLSRVQLNNVDLLQFSSPELKNCQMPYPQIMTIRSGAVHIAYSFLPFTVEFRIPNKPTSLLTILNAINETLLQIVVNEKRILSLEAETRYIRQFSLPAIIVNDGNWHSLSVKLRGGRLDVELDTVTVLWMEGLLVKKIGLQITTFQISAVGCYRSTTVDLYSAVPLNNAQIVKKKCLYSENCLPNPCKNFGECVQVDLDNFYCECAQYYTGNFCHTSLLHRTCEDYYLKQRILLNNDMSNLMSLQKINTYYITEKEEISDNVTIDLDGGGPLKPFQVTCITPNLNISRNFVEWQKKKNILKSTNFYKEKEKNKNQNNEYDYLKNNFYNKPEFNFNNYNKEDNEITILNHDALDSIVVTNGVTEPGATRRTLLYNDGIDGIEMDRFVDGYHSCKQFMRFECTGGTKLMTYGQERRPSTWYATRNGQHGLQWADAPPYSRMCGCALNSSCEENKMCNCDSGKNGVDEGWNNYQQLLPIMQLFIGGTSNTPHSSAKITIGPLICTKRRVFDTVTFIDKNQQLVGTQTFDAPIFDVYVYLRFTHSQMTIFTWESANAQQWFQIFVREGKLVGQLVNAGQINEIISDFALNDNRWYSVYWEIDRFSMKLTINNHEKIISSSFLLPSTFTYIIGSRTGRGNAGFAGQIRSLYLVGQEIQLLQMVKKLNKFGVQPGEVGFCKNESFSNSRKNKCANDGQCIEYYDRFKCNCSMTPFAGEKCDQEVGIWVPLNSQVSIPWQHPSHMSSTCYQINIYTASKNISLIKSKALFAESSFNLSIDHNGFLQLWTYDGFFFNHTASFTKFPLNDNMTKDIRFCASKTKFRLTINEEEAILLYGNFTYFQNLNVWNFIDKNFTGCIARLRIGNGFPLKNPFTTRLSYSSGIKFSNCPYGQLNFAKPEEFIYNEESFSKSNIQITAIVKNQQRLLLITPAIGLFVAFLIVFALCFFVCYVQSRPDGVYKTNETLMGFATTENFNRLEPVNKSIDPLVIKSGNYRHYKISKNLDEKIIPQISQTNTLFTKEYFC